MALYVEATFAEIDKALVEVPVDKRPLVYLARGPDGLETGVVGSINTEIIERAGGRNVAEAAGQRGLVRASIEQVIVADPEIIITWDRNFFDRVGKDPLWAGIRAVRESRIYLAPTAPFGWIDRPPSLNRVIGLKWLAGLFYPDRFTADFRATTKAFYRLFYHVDPSDPELDLLVTWSKGQAPVPAATQTLNAPGGDGARLVAPILAAARRRQATCAPDYRGGPESGRRQTATFQRPQLCAASSGWQAGSWRRRARTPSQLARGWRE